MSKFPRVKTHSTKSLNVRGNREQEKSQKSYNFFYKIFKRNNYSIAELFELKKEFQDSQDRLENSKAQLMVLNTLINEKLEITVKTT